MQSNPFKSNLLRLLAAALILVPHAALAQASEALVVELYENCQLIDTNVVIEPGVLTPEKTAEVKARVNAVSGEARAAMPRIVQVLKNHGIEDVEVSRQGFAGCEPQTSGKYVEAVGTYCGATLRRAEVLVDQESFYSVSEPGMSFEEFLNGATKRLREQGIPDRPLVSIENAPDCEASQ